MTGRGEDRTNVRFNLQGAFTSDDIALMETAIEAVCGEFGITSAAPIKRDAVARNVLAAYEVGRRQPLYLVKAGMDALHC